MVIEPLEMFNYLEKAGGFPRDIITNFFLKHVEEGNDFLENLIEGDSFYLVVDEKEDHSSFTIYNIDVEENDILDSEHIVATDAIRLLKEVIAN